MRRSTWFAAVVGLVTTAAACGDPFTVGIPADPDSGPPCCDDAGPDEDSAIPTPDAHDSGHPDQDAAEHDTGSPPPVDSGSDADTATDSGCACPDSGSETGVDSGSDSGSTDAGVEASVDAGSDADVDSGSVDSGSPDSGSVDSGSDAGSSDAGVDGPSDSGADSPSDAGSDSGDAASVCATPGTYSCDSNGVTPLVCSAGHTWVAAGGDCNYGCPNVDGGTGLCTCSAPLGRLTVTLVDYADGGGLEYTLNDSVTTYKFVVVKGCSSLSTCSALCVSDFGGTLATITEVQTLLSEQSPATECNTPDTDSIIETAHPAGFGATTVFTDYSSCGGGSTNYLDLNTGTIVCGSGGQAWCKVP